MLGSNQLPNDYVSFAVCILKLGGGRGNRTLLVDKLARPIRTPVTAPEILVRIHGVKSMPFGLKPNF